MPHLFIVLLRLLAGAAFGVVLAVALAVLGYAIVYPPGSSKDDATGLGAVLPAMIVAPPAAVLGAIFSLRPVRKSRLAERGPAPPDDWKAPDADLTARILSGRSDGGTPHNPDRDGS